MIHVWFYIWPYLLFVASYKPPNQMYFLAASNVSSPRMLSTFEMSLDQGKPVLIENMGEGAAAKPKTCFGPDNNVTFR